MSYTVWLDGTKIGETSLELSHGVGKRAGVFHPTAPGLAVLPGITAMAPALFDAGRIYRDSGIDPDDVELDDDSLESFFETPEGHRILEAAKLISRVELHGPAGELVPWESLLISDMTELAALARSPATERRDPPSDGQPRDPIRYFISATLHRHRIMDGPRRARRST